VISFARFMELALYCPDYGYYEKEEDRIGRRGDYYTSVSVGSLFGELLACQFAEWLSQCQGQNIQDGNEEEKDDDGVQIVEAGAHDGSLAGDILAWLQKYRAQLLEKLEYSIIEPSQRRRRWQQQALQACSDKVCWFRDFNELKKESRLGRGAREPKGVRGIIFSNELLDAFPVHRLGWDAKARAWFEWGVAIDNGSFAWRRMNELEAALRNQAWWELPAELLEVLPDGFTTEVCPAAEKWWAEAAMVLGCGKLVTIDYGLTEEELLKPERKQGTLRAYHHHRPGSELLADPGEQDITAHVNFSAIQAIGHSLGLKTDAFLTQEQFLIDIVAKLWKEGSAWKAESGRAFQTLTHQQQLGRLLKVLIQAKPSQSSL